MDATQHPCRQRFHRDSGGARGDSDSGQSTRPPLVSDANPVEPDQLHARMAPSIPLGSAVSPGECRGSHAPPGAREPHWIERPGSARGAQSGEVRWPWRRHRPAGRARAAGPDRSAARMSRTASRSSTVAITRSRPPQFGQANTSIANARRMGAAQVQLRGGAPAGLGGAKDGGLGRRPTIAHDLGRQRALASAACRGYSCSWKRSPRRVTA